MNAVIQVFSAPLAERIGWVLVHSIWQGTIVALILAMALRLLRQRSAETRYLSAAMALLVIVVCPFLTNAQVREAADQPRPNLGMPAEPAVYSTGPSLTDGAPDAVVQGESLPIHPSPRFETHVPHPAVAASTSESLPSAAASEALITFKDLHAFVKPFLPWLVGGWLGGVLVCSLRLLIAWQHVRTLRASGVTVAAEQFVSAAHRLADRMGIRHSVTLLESKIVEIPMVVGWLKPVILLPVAAVAGLSAVQIEAIIAHELAHVRRWDYPVNLLQSIVETILFYHPAVWWVSRKMRQERENCCDDIASEVCGDRVSYARSLLQMEELRPPKSLVLAATGGDLMARVRRLIAPGSGADGSVRGFAGLVALLVVGTALAGIHLAETNESVLDEETNPGAKAILRDGDVIVEFAALSRDPTNDTSWWQPNGEPYPAAFGKDSGARPQDSDPLAWNMGFVVQSSYAKLAVAADFPQIHGSWSSWSTAPDEGVHNVNVRKVFTEDSDSVNVDLLLSLEDWRPWKYVQLGEDVIEPWGRGGFTLRANRANTAGLQPGELLHAFEHPGRDHVEIVVAWPRGFETRAKIEVEAFDADGNEITHSGVAGYQYAHGSYFEGTRQTTASFRYRLRYYTDQVSFADASLIPGQSSQVTHRVVRLDVPPRELTPGQIADRIEATMKRFESVEYQAESTANVNTNAFRTDVEPVLVTGDTQYLYRSDGSRWFVEEDAFTWNQGESELRPLDTLAGFDGALHYSVDRFGSVQLGEENLSNTRLSPRAVFWRAGRTADWLLAALRRDEARIESDQQTDGRRVVQIVSDWKRGEQHWRFEIEVLPNHSWLPLSTKVFHGGKLIAAESTEELAQSDDGIWYPRQIHWSVESEPFASTLDKTIKVTSFTLRDDFKDADFEWQLPPGRAIIDHRSGATWYNDPWWSELAPWLRETLDYPPPDLSALRDFQSYADNAIDGMPAPAIQAAEWIVGEDPGPWTRDDRRPTLLFFFGGRAISPTPKQLVALKTLAERYKEAGLEDSGLNVVGVASASKTPEMTRQAVKELQVSFPVAIDSPNEDGSGFGQTFAAYGLKAYVGIFVIDSQGITHLVEPSNLPTDSDTSALAFVLQNLDQGAIRIDSDVNRDRSFSRKEHDRVQAEWQRLAAAATGTGRITGRIEATSAGRDVFGSDGLNNTDRSGVAATIEIVPVLKLLQGSAFSTHVAYDRERVQVVECQGDGTFEATGLCRGEYRVTILPPGMARTEQNVILVNDAATAQVNVLLNQSDQISGTVVDTAGEPIVGATISATKRHFNPAYIRQYTTAHLAPKTVTDKQGNFVYDGLFVGAYTFHVEADGYEAKDTEPVPAGRHEVNIQLKEL